MRCPVAAKMALATAAPTGGKPGSPKPVGDASLFMNLVSMSGASAMRIILYVLKFFCCATPLSKDISENKAWPIPSIIPPSIPPFASNFVWAKSF